MCLNPFLLEIKEIGAVKKYDHGKKTTLVGDISVSKVHAEINLQSFVGKKTCQRINTVETSLPF
jgi:hypothetical protein